jgi:hypothetical protein
MVTLKRAKYAWFMEPKSKGPWTSSPKGPIAPFVGNPAIMAFRL